jgi:hypothetical protein
MTHVSISEDGANRKQTQRVIKSSEYPSKMPIMPSLAKPIVEPEPLGDQFYTLSNPNHHYIGQALRSSGNKQYAAAVSTVPLP